MNSPRITLVLGLLITAVAFLLLERNWGLAIIPPLGPIQNPFAAILGLIGLITILLAGKQLRHQRDSPPD